MATLRKIATMSGVSVAAVSYALNGLGNVSEDTRSRVLGVAEKLNYVHGKGRGRRSLKLHQSTEIRTIGFLSCLGFSPLGEIYFGQILNGCTDAAGDKGIPIQVIEVNPDATTLNDLPVSLRQNMPDGFIVTGWPCRGLVDMLSSFGRPMVMVDVRDVYEGFTHVRPDNFGGVIKAINYLSSLGHSRIGVVAGDLDFACEVERLAGYYTGMTLAKLPIDEKWIIRNAHMTERSGYDGMKALMAEGSGVTAVMCYGDILARGAMAAAHELGMHVPNDISIIGFDNQPWTANAICPLTTVDTYLHELGSIAVRQLRYLSKKTNTRAEKLNVEAELVVRSSCAAVK